MNRRTPWLVLAVALALASFHGHAQDPAKPAPGAPASVLAYGVVGDGKADDAPAIQRALDQNPGGVVVVPDRGGSGWAADYYCGSTLKLRGHGQTLRGECDGWGGRVCLKFPAGVTGIVIENGSGQGARIADLNLQGSEPWTGIDPDQAVLPEGFGGKAGASTADGIRVRAGLVTIERVAVYYFGRHGIDVGADGAMGDSFLIVGCQTGNNRGSGLHLQGADSNAGTTIGHRSTGNQLYGIDDSSFLGNVHIASVTHANHSSLWATPEARAKIDAIWAAAGAEGGSFRGPDTSNIGNVFIGPYAENDQPPPRWAWKDIVIGGAISDGPPHFHIKSGANGWNAWGTPFLAMTNGVDRTGIVTYKAGKTAGQDIHVVARNLDGSAAWTESFGVFGSAWELWEGEAGTGKLRMRFPKGGPPTIDGNPIGAGRPGPPGPQGPPGPAGPAAPRPIRVQDEATIPRGKTSVVVEHGLGGQPAIEDVAVVLWGPTRVWLGGTSDKTLTFRIEKPAPAAGITFTYSASRIP